MSLQPRPVSPIPDDTLRVAQAAFPHGAVVTRLRDEFADLCCDEDFAALYPRRGQPELAPWRLALVTVLQFLEHLSDRQAADAVRSRIDWKYALGLHLDDPGFHSSVLTEFRSRLLVGHAEYLLFDKMLAHFKARGLIRPRGRQRTDSTHVLGAVRDLRLLELVTETMRAALNELATLTMPEWLGGRRGRAGVVRSLCPACRGLALARRQQGQTRGLRSTRSASTALHCLMSRASEFRILRTSCDEDQFGCRTRMRIRSSLARPYIRIWRLRYLSRLIWPSTWPLLQCE